MTRRNQRNALILTAILLLACSPLRAQAPPPPAFLADHYDVSATLDTITQSLSAVAKVDFKARDVSSAVRIELHPNLNVTDVKSAEGKTLGFERDTQNPLNLIVNLPSPVATGAKVTLTFTYAGPLANEENSPVPGVRAAAINREGAFLLLPARWFPLTNYPLEPLPHRHLSSQCSGFLRRSRDRQSRRSDAHARQKYRRRQSPRLHLSVR